MRAVTAAVIAGIMMFPAAHAKEQGGKGGEKVSMQRVEEIIADSCTYCHGDHGEASNPMYPRLAHQNRQYIIKQLKNFRDRKRLSDIMNEQAAGISDAEIEALAGYFSSQPPLAHRLDDFEQEQLLHKLGEYVFKYGDPYADIPPCSTCHGKSGEGSRNLPRLAGQHRHYIVRQLKAFSSRRRTNDNAIMQSIASRLSPLAMQGVALYLSTLAPRR